MLLGRFLATYRPGRNSIFAGAARLLLIVKILYPAAVRAAFALAPTAQRL
jgi:hypothetical protein